MKKIIIFTFGIIASHTAFADGDLFKQLDTNSDSQISIEEAAADPTVSAKFSELDTNKDGYISAEEFEYL